MKRNKKKKQYFEPHVRLHLWMMKSEAWRSLSTQARAVLVEIYARYNGMNNGKIALSTREAAQRCKISKDTATRTFRELQDKGFIVQTSAGSFNRKVPHAAEWRLTEHRDDMNSKMPTREFMSWSRTQNLESGPK